MIKDYVSQFKFKVIRPLIEAIESGLLYNPLGLVSQSLFERSQLFNHRIDRYRGNDHVSGIIDGVPIQFSDLHAEYKTTDSKGRTSWHTLFQGLFIVSEFRITSYNVCYTKLLRFLLPETAAAIFPIPHCIPATISGPAMHL